VSADGGLVRLEDQDRSRWDAAEIREGLALVEHSLRAGRVGPYQLQAAIAAVHDEAPTAGDTDWGQVLGLYDVLRRVAPSPVVELNRAVAVGQVLGPEAGLAAADALASAPGLAEYRFLHATRADFLRRLGRWAEAGAAYERAIGLAPNRAERAFLESRLAEVRGRAVS
jgi:RNA polymerase sigma-70 factor (ECF subfamily)